MIDANQKNQAKERSPTPCPLSTLPSLCFGTKYRAKDTVVIEGAIVIDWRKKSHAKKGIPKQYDDKHTANRRHVIIFHVVFFFFIVNNYY